MGKRSALTDIIIVHCATQLAHSHSPIISWCISCLCSGYPKEVLPKEALPKDGEVGNGESSSSKMSAEEKVPEKTLQPPPLIHAEGNGSLSKQRM